MSSPILVHLSEYLCEIYVFTDYIGLYSTTATYLASKEIEIGEKNAK